MSTDNQIATLSHDIYSGSPGFTTYFPEEGFGICCAILLSPIENIIIFRGTVPTEFQNWLQDLLAYARPFPHSTFGPLHAGSFAGLPDMLAELVPQLDLTLPTTIAGHSLGGQRATEATAIMLDEYQPDPTLLRLITFGAPAAGFQQLLTYLKDVKITAYRNAEGFYGDPVPLLPFDLPPVFAYRNPPFTHVTKSPGGLLDLDPVAWHNSELYAQVV